MSEAILDIQYWKERLEKAKHTEIHQAIFLCGLDHWQKIEQRHREILAATIKPSDSVLDAGCGWGRLLTLMPVNWFGSYLGVDLSPDFIEMARFQYRDSLGYRRQFFIGDLRELYKLYGPVVPIQVDWAVLISIRPMVINYAGEETWAVMEWQLRRVAKNILYLEYDVNDTGAIE